jgi:hypothetical protein
MITRKHIVVIMEKNFIKSIECIADTYENACLFIHENPSLLKTESNKNASLVIQEVVWLEG